MSTSYYQSIIDGYKIQATEEPEGPSGGSVEKYRKQLAAVLNTYLNEGAFYFLA